MSHSLQCPVLMLPSDNEGTPDNTAVNKSGTDLHFVNQINFISFVLGSHQSRTLMSTLDNCPIINGQSLDVSNVSSDESSLQSTGQFKFEDLPTWTLLPDSDSIASQTDHSDNELQINDDLDTNEEPRKRQKTEPITGNGRRSTRVDDSKSIKRSLPMLQNSTMPIAKAIGSADTCRMDVAIPNDSLLIIKNTKEAKPSPTTSISSYIQIKNCNLSPISATTIVKVKSTQSYNPSAKDEEMDSISTHSRKRTNGLYGLLVPRALTVSKSTSSSDSLKSVREEPPRKTRGLGLTKLSHGTKSKKSQGRQANQDELEVWTNTDVAHIRFREPDELKLLDEMEEEIAKRNVAHILACLIKINPENSNENVASNETILNDVQNQAAIPDSSIYTRCEDLVGEVFGVTNSRNRFRMVPHFLLNLNLKLISYVYRVW